MTGQLLRIAEDATTSRIDNTYQGIRDAIGNTFDYVYADPRLGAYVDDEGLLQELALNVVASMFVGVALFGPVVVCHGDPDDNGDTLPLDEGSMVAIESAAKMWQNVIDNATGAGQDITVNADSGTIPPFQVIPMPDNWMPGDPIAGQL